MRYGPTYYDAKALQTQILQAVRDEKPSARELAQLVRSWIDLERFKREMRGIPPLAAAKVGELLANMKRARPAALKEPVELEPEEVGDAAEV